MICTDNSITQKILDAMARDGIENNEQILIDGALHRFHVEGDSNATLNGWYIFNEGDNEIIWGSYGCWKRNIKRNWSSKRTSDLSELERSAFAKEIKAANEKQKKLRIELHVAARDKALRIWNEAKPANDHHPYLLLKGVKAHN